MASNPIPEFRAEAVRVALTSRLPRKHVAADFSVSFSTLSLWVQQDRRNPEQPTAHSDLKREIVELRKENRVPRQHSWDIQFDFLKEGFWFIVAAQEWR